MTTAQAVVDRLVDQQLVQPEHRDRALGVVAGALAAPTTDRPSGPAPRPASGAVVEVVAYLGTALVLAAGSLFGLSYWDSIGFGAQVGVLSVMTAALLVAGLAVVGVAGRDGGAAVRREPATDARRRLTSTLLTGAALAGGTLLGVVVERVTGSPAFSGEGLDQPLVAGSAACLLVALLGRRLADSAFGTLVVFGALTTLVATVVARVDGDRELSTTAVLLLVALGWLVLTELRDRHAPTLGRVLGVGLALYAAQLQTWQGSDTDWIGYLLTALVVVLGAAAYLCRGAWPYLAVAVVGVTIVVPEAVHDWTGGGLGAIGAVLVTGVTLLAASGAAALVRSRRTP